MGKNKKEIERSITTPPSSSPFLFFFLMDVGTTPTIRVTGTRFENLYQRTFSHALIFLTYTLYVAYFRHYPTTKFTAVADTPENKRLAANTKKQSNVSPFFYYFALIYYYLFIIALSPLCSHLYIGQEKT